MPKFGHVFAHEEGSEASAPWGGVREVNGTTCRTIERVGAASNEIGVVVAIEVEGILFVRRRERLGLPEFPRPGSAHRFGWESPQTDRENPSDVNRGSARGGAPGRRCSPIGPQGAATLCTMSPATMRQRRASFGAQTYRGSSPGLTYGPLRKPRPSYGSLVHSGTPRFVLQTN